MTTSGSQSKASAFGTAIVATCLWGLSGTVSQILFQREGFPPEGLVTLRLFIASGILFIWLRPNWPRAHTGAMIVFGVLGILPSQLFYFLAINYSNAAVATLLQLLFLPIVAIYEIAIHVYRFSYSHLAAIALAMIGTFLLVADGSSLSLHVTFLGLIFGILCAVAAAYYTLASKKLTGIYGSWSITAWGFLVAGIASLPIGTATLIHEKFTLQILALILFVAIFGTLFAYGLYVRSLERLTGTEASIAATGEPIMAAVASYLLLGVLLTPLQYFGGALILVAIIFLKNVIKKTQ